MTPPAERCPTCDREGCNGARMLEEYKFAAGEGDIDRATNALLALTASGCHRVDWRARAIAAEARIATVAAEIEHDVGVKRSHDHGRATGGQTCGTGGPLTGAPQSMLRYLDRVVRDLHDERTRAIADHAAQWAKVAPLIERLREAFDSDDALHEIAPAAFAIVAATEATP